METIKIDIKKLGIIQNSNIEVAPVMIFSGESGLGKSYVAMLCHYFFDVLTNGSRFNQFVKEKGWSFFEMRTALKGKGIAFSFSKNELEKWMEKDSIQYLSYMLNNEQLSADIKITLPATIPDKIEMYWEEDIDGIEQSEEVYVKLSALNLSYRTKEETLGMESPFSYLLRFALIGKIFGDFNSLSETYLFPPSRGAILTEKFSPLSGMYREFDKGLDKIKSIPPHPKEVDTQLVGLLKNILVGSVNWVDGKYMYVTNGIELPLSAAASSIRELAPIAMLAERMEIKNIAMLIEEPEAHLHSLKQRMIADVISLMSNAGMFMQITTHSDYFLRRINELIKLKKIQQKVGGNSDKYEEKCSELGINAALAFKHERLSTYLLKARTDGTSEIVKQDIDDGIPFDSFEQAIDESLEFRYRIDKYLNEEDESN